MKPMSDHDTALTIGHMNPGVSVAQAELIIGLLRRNGWLSPADRPVHTFITFANPYLTCDQCGAWVGRWHSNDRCGCDGTCWNEPCGHVAGTTSVCPSWDPVDGCCCTEILGRVDHQEPPRETGADE